MSNPMLLGLPFAVLPGAGALQRKVTCAAQTHVPLCGTVRAGVLPCWRGVWLPRPIPVPAPRTAIICCIPSTHNLCCTVARMLVAGSNFLLYQPSTHRWRECSLDGCTQHAQRAARHLATRAQQLALTLASWGMVAQHGTATDGRLIA